jgi:hypothetical protein
MDHSLTYDPVQDRVLLFGGTTILGGSVEVVRNEIYSLSLGPAPAWTLISAAGQPPPPRRHHSACVDLGRGRLLVFGGFGLEGGANDVWAFSLGPAPQWIPLAPSGPAPPPRWSAGAVVDAVAERMVLFGGNAGGSANDAWALSLADPPTWSPLVVDGIRPKGRQGHSMAMDPIEGRALVFGGGRLRDTWALDLGDTPRWRNVAGPPEARRSHTAIFDPIRGRMIVFGGESVNAGSWSNDTWVLELRGTPYWHQIESGGAHAPSIRLDHTATFDPVRDQMIVYGGRVGFAAEHGDVWALSLGSTPSWTQIVPAGYPPQSRSKHSAAYDPVGDRLIVVGGEWSYSLYTCGYNPVPYYPSAADVWSLPLGAPLVWEQLRAEVGLYSDASVAWDPVDHRMLHLGGSRISTWCNWDSYNMAVFYFEQCVAIGLSPPYLISALNGSGLPFAPGAGHSVVYDPAHDRLLLFGGGNGTTVNSDVRELSLRPTPVLSALPALGTPPPAGFGQSAIFDPETSTMWVHSPTGDGSLWRFVIDAPTPAIASVVRAEVQREWVEIEWHVSQGREDVWTVQRADGDGDWGAAGQPALRGTDRLVFRDASIREGNRYGYRLASALHSRGIGEVWVTSTPRELSLAPPMPNPASDRVTLALQLPDARPATLQVIDVNGRMVDSRPVGPSEPGPLSVQLDLGTTLRPGVFFLRLVHPAGVVTRRLAIID